MGWRIYAAIVAIAAVADQTEEQAARDLAVRVLGSARAGNLSLELVGSPRGSGGDYFELPVSAAKAPITIRGTSGVALASGLHWYLKYHCGVGIRYGDVRVTELELPTLPAIKVAERVGAFLCF